MYKLRTEDGKNNLCGDNLKRIREVYGLSQRKLAEKLQLNGIDIDRHVIRRIENKERFFTDIEISAICRTLNIPYEMIFDGIGL